MGKPAKSIFLVHSSSGYWDRIQGTGLPLSILHAATLAHQKYDVQLLDLRFAFFWADALRRRILEEKPLIVGLTVLVGPQLAVAIRISRLVKKVSPRTTVVWGGVFPSLNAELVFTEPSVDYIVFGEGEQTLVNLADALVEGGTAVGVPNVLDRAGGVKPLVGKGFLKLDDLPHLPYDLLPVHRYMRDFRGGAVLPIETSRGCPYRCDFCYNEGISNGRWRMRSPQRMREELALIQRKFNPSKIFIIDDNFFAHHKRALEIGEVLAQTGMSWSSHGLTPMEAPRFDRDELKLLRDQGCTELRIGLENVAPNVQRQMNKHFDGDKVRAFNRRAAEFDIKLSYSLVFGYPEETIEDIQHNLRFMFELLAENKNAALFMINIVFPLPGSELYNKCGDEAWKRNWTLQKWGEWEINRIGGPWLSPQKLRLCRSISFASLFVSPRFYTNPVLRVLEAFRRVYAPIARRRLQGLDFRYIPEIAVGNEILGLIIKFLR
jgi:radical SAM superfamily enzyme YgiQ (UPF0313 family)